MRQLAVLEQMRDALPPIPYPTFRGNWSLPWVSGRYVFEAAAGMRPSRLPNAALAIMEMKLALPRVRSLPFVLRLEPTSTCNLRCPRCSTGLGIEPRPKGFLSLDDADHLIDVLRESVIFVRLDGNGEPLLHPQICTLISRFKAAGIGVVISSHFNTMPREGVEALVESGLDRLIVAIDGSTQEVYQRYRRGGELATVLANLERFVELKRRSGRRRPVLDLQFLDWGYNRHQIPEMREMARRFGANRLTVIRPDYAAAEVKADPLHPKRCFWLWCVLTVGWDLDVHSCTNAWTYQFPRATLRTASVRDLWNSEPLVEARRFNRNKKSAAIAGDTGCMCNQCTDMLVIDRPKGYVCE